MRSKKELKEELEKAEIDIEKEKGHINNEIAVKSKILTLRWALGESNPTCAVCEDELKNKLHVLDAQWERISEKHICRECARKIAQMVVDDY